MESLIELEKSIALASKVKGPKLTLGDFNFPKLLWDIEHTPSAKPGYSTSSVYYKLLEVIEDFSLT
ncbi:hypothetical protein DPMN_127791 [Dreissena polymorpha]|uniref:Uncharacterized protein n=1 Tax=Dreissena polymorpha TaxID=45954 RepID=A0A9D4JVS5_DREPO|nr:hypothetical protein DPMN_127791 [Dreissena polymorpha]